MLSSCVFSFGIVSMEYIFKYNFMLKYYHYYYYKIGITIQLGIPPFSLNITESRSFFYPCGDGVCHLLGVPYQSIPRGWCAPSLQGPYTHQEGDAPHFHRNRSPCSQDNPRPSTTYLFILTVYLYPLSYPLINW